MLREDISTKGPSHIYCSEQFNLLDSHAKGQLEFTNEESLGMLTTS